MIRSLPQHVRCLAGVAALAALGILLAGCSRAPSTPAKLIKTPKGGEPVLTAVERRAPANLVALASFEQELLPARSVPLKPLEHLTEQETAADALGRIGAPAVPALMEALQSSDVQVRVKAADVLGRMGPDANDAVPALIRLLDDPDERVRKTATRALGRIGPSAKAAVPVLMRSLFQGAAQPPAG
jgi:HEAT repeat protein